jgi:hypothetical protein
VAAAFTLTVSWVAGPGAFSVNPQRLNSSMAKVAPSYNVAGSHFNAVPDVLRIGERDDAGYARGDCNAEEKKKRILQNIANRLP